MTAPSVGAGSIRLAELLLNVAAAMALVVGAAVPGGNTASPARAAGGGTVPSGVMDGRIMLQRDNIDTYIVLPRGGPMCIDRQVC